MNVLYMLVLILLMGGLVLIFGHDWVWKIDSRNEAHERDVNGNPIRTTAWDRNHRLQGIVMVVVAIVLGLLINVLL